ncbi:hypothetical protein J1605_016870 [Eschrichtius robustus]|uniref:Uncharacterized protein n=1 Tax=Eschrichtius robustus TaxID=9764 RepID=A0AB34HYV2_ESCRO|nr:hypothetical protein J1605_016870 [Eschrichtius robustus]
MGEGLVTTPEALLQVRCGGLISVIEEVEKQPRDQSISSPKACTVPLTLGYFRFLSMHASPQCIYLLALGHLDQMLSGYQVHLTLPASVMPPKCDSNEIKVMNLRYTCEEVSATSSLAPKIILLDLSPKNVSDDITKTTGYWKGLTIIEKPFRTNRPRLK